MPECLNSHRQDAPEDRCETAQVICLRFSQESHLSARTAVGTTEHLGALRSTQNGVLGGGGGASLETSRATSGTTMGG